MNRRLSSCRQMVFIAYSVPSDAEDRGYSDWLRRIDNPFFNAVQGMGHYANWRLTGPAPFPWDYFDYMAISTVGDLESVWFDKGLDGFRKEWLRLWGYGRPGAEPPPHLRYSYLFEQVGAGSEPGETATVVFGSGDMPEGADILWRRTGFLPKHFAAAARDPAAPWLLPDVTPDPLGFTWIASFGQPPAVLPDGAVAVPATRIAAP